MATSRRCSCGCHPASGSYNVRLLVVRKLGRHQLSHMSGGAGVDDALACAACGEVPCTLHNHNRQLRCTGAIAPLRAASARLTQLQPRPALPSPFARKPPPDGGRRAGTSTPPESFGNGRPAGLGAAATPSLLLLLLLPGAAACVDHPRSPPPQLTYRSSCHSASASPPRRLHGHHNHYPQPLSLHPSPPWPQIPAPRPSAPSFVSATAPPRLCRPRRPTPAPRRRSRGLPQRLSTSHSPSSTRTLPPRSRKPLLDARFSRSSSHSLDPQPDASRGALTAAFLRDSDSSRRPGFMAPLPDAAVFVVAREASEHCPSGRPRPVAAQDALQAH